MRATVGKFSRFLTGGATWDDVRDNFVTDICNFLIMNVASRQFGTKLALVIEHGMTEAEAGKVPGLVKKDGLL